MLDAGYILSKINR